MGNPTSVAERIVTVSHVVAHPEVCFNDFDALKSSCEELGLEFRQDQKTWKYWGSWANDYHQEDAAYKHGIEPKDYGKGLHAIAVKGDKEAYEIGLVLSPKDDGSFMPVYDFYGQHGKKIQQKAGAKLEKLRGKYAEHAIRNQAQKQGHAVRKVVSPQGHVQMVVTQR
jgi:Protein of unknown function (DUF1257)